MKTIAFAILASLGTATLVAADTNYIALQHELSSSSLVELDLVRAAQPGRVVIADLAGNVLGSASVHPGANVDVKVPLIRIATADVMATIMSEDGTVVAEHRIRVE